MSNLITEDIVVTRTFAAAPEAVWKAWTAGAEVTKWWGPDQFTAPAATMDVRPGGTSLVCMRSPDGQDIWMTWWYVAVEPGKRLEYIQNLSDADGNLLDPAVIGMPAEFPRDVRTVVTVAAKGTGTETTISEHTTTTEFMMRMSRMGLEQCLDKMGRVLVR